MSELTRKQREILQREQLIKQCALEQLQQDGFHALSMDKIAKSIEYSKGTIYQHFSCKEDIIGTLCIDCTAQIIELFRQASSLFNKSREQMLAIFFTYLLNWQLHPANTDILQIARSPAVQEKLSADIEQQISRNEQQLLTHVAGIVRQGIDSGELTLSTDIHPQELVFGLWAMVYGGMILETTAIPWSQLGINQPSEVILKVIQTSLDGLGWQPASSDMDLDSILTKVKKLLFHPDKA